MNNKNGSKPMSYKQKNYIKNLLSYKVITDNYHGYAGYVLKILQGKTEITLKHASCIIDTLKGMIDIENAKKNSDNDGNGDGEIEEETIE